MIRRVGFGPVPFVAASATAFFDRRLGLVVGSAVSVTLALLRTRDGPSAGPSVYGGRPAPGTDRAGPAAFGLGSRSVSVVTHPVGDRREDAILEPMLLEQQRGERCLRQDEEARLPGRDGRRRPRAAGDERDLAEIVALAQVTDLSAVDADLDLAVGDHEELLAALTLHRQDRTGRDGPVLDQPGDGRKVG